MEFVGKCKVRQVVFSDFKDYLLHVVSVSIHNITGTKMSVSFVSPISF